jgi:hypothetical protein
VALLAKVVQRYRVYPSGSPLLVEALEACHRALAALDREELQLRVGPRALLVDDVAVARTPGVAELTRRLHQAGIGTVTLFRDAPLRELGCLCREIAAHDEAAGRQAAEALPDRLGALGVARVQVSMLVRPAVLEVGTPPAGQAARLRDLRARPAPAPPPGTAHLYPPDKGWVRVDPGVAAPDTLTITQLAELVADPFTISGMLVALSGEASHVDPRDALDSKFEEVSALLRSAEAPLAQTLMAQLARAVLDLEPERRQNLLRNTILPGLLEGRFDGTLLRHFPDLELADSLSLLLDLQVAAPELLMMALDRVELPAERRAAIEPLLAERLERRAPAADGLVPGQIDGLARGRIHVDISRQKEFREFASYDLAVDADTAAALDEARDAIAGTVGAVEHVRCLVHLLHLEANPEAAGRLLQSVSRALGTWRQARAWDHLADWIAALAGLADRNRDDRPEIAERIEAVVAQTADASLVDELARAAQGDPSPPGRVVEAFGAAFVPFCVEALARDHASTRRQAVLQLMMAHARVLAPGIAPRLHHPDPHVTHSLIGVLGQAGAGWESVVAQALAHPHTRVVREALRSLALIGTPEALRAVAARLTSSDEGGHLAEETFWQFAAARVEACALLRRRDFTDAHPALARRLLEKAAASRTDDLAPVTADLARLRYRIWSPSHVRLGMAAFRLRRSR